MPLLSVTYIQGYCSVTRVPLPWFMSNWKFPFLLYASSILPDKIMASTVKRKLSLGTFLSLMAGFYVIYGHLCVGSMTHNVYGKGS
jgi:hypothetical protein